MKRLLNYDPDTGMYEWFHGHGDGGFSIETYQDPAVVKAIIDHTDSFDAGGKFTREASLLVSPNGRPLHRVG